MYQTATITDKRQLTIPATFFRQLGLQEGQKVIISVVDDALKIESAKDLVNQLAGSFGMPEKYKNMDIDKAILRAKNESIQDKHSQNNS